MESIRLVTETFLRLLKTEIDPDAVLVAAEDVFDVPHVPSLVVQGPTLVEDAARRTLALRVVRDPEAMTFQAGHHPRLYHLEFDLVVTAGHEGDLLDLMTKMARCYQRHPVLTIPDTGALPLTELTPLGGGRRVNLSNLRQASGRCRIEDCPVDDGGWHETAGRLVRTPRIILGIGG